MSALNSSSRQQTGSGDTRTIAVEKLLKILSLDWVKVTLQRCLSCLADGRPSEVTASQSMRFFADRRICDCRNGWWQLRQCDQQSSARLMVSLACRPARIHFSRAPESGERLPRSRILPTTRNARQGKASCQAPTISARTLTHSETVDSR